MADVGKTHVAGISYLLQALGSCSGCMWQMPASHGRHWLEVADFDYWWNMLASSGRTHLFGDFQMLPVIKFCYIFLGGN